MPFTVTFSMCPYRDTWVISQKASAALKYMSGVGAEPSPPRFGPSSHANVLCAVPLWLTVASKTFACDEGPNLDRKSTRLNSSHSQISYAVFCLKKNTNGIVAPRPPAQRGPLSALVQPHRPAHGP